MHNRHCERIERVRADLRAAALGGMMEALLGR